MSFSGDVRKEISSAINNKEMRYVCLYGMLLMCRTITPEKLIFQSKSHTVSDTFAMLMDKVFKVSITPRETVSKTGKSLYTFDITDSGLIGNICTRYHIDPNDRKFDPETIASHSLGTFLAGAFLASGSVNDPEKEYHLEFSAPNVSLADHISAILGDIGASAKTVVRRGQYVVYIKGSEYIEDTLTFMGARQCTLDLINVKIYKDVRNKANRIANCDNANIDKVVAAAIKQIEDIRLIADRRGLDSLSPELKEIAQLRLENTGMSLQEIGESLSTPISRSGVNHRFKKLKKIADEIREEAGVPEI